MKQIVLVLNKRVKSTLNLIYSGCKIWENKLHEYDLLLIGIKCPFRHRGTIYYVNN